MRISKFIIIGTLLSSFTSAFAQDVEKVCWTDSFSDTAQKLSALASRYKDQKDGPRFIFRNEIKAAPAIDTNPGYGMLARIAPAVVHTPNGLGHISQKLFPMPIASTQLPMPMPFAVPKLHLEAGTSLKLVGVDLSKLESKGEIELALENGIQIKLQESTGKRGAGDMIDTLFGAGIKTIGTMENAIKCSLDSGKKKKLANTSVSESDEKQASGHAEQSTKKLAKTAFAQTL